MKIASSRDYIFYPSVCPSDYIVGTLAYDITHDYSARHVPVVYDQLPDAEYLVMLYELSLVEMQLRDLQHNTIN